MRIYKPGDEASYKVEFYKQAYTAEEFEKIGGFKGSHKKFWAIRVQFPEGVSRGLGDKVSEGVVDVLLEILNASEEFKKIVYLESKWFFDGDSNLD